jgi:hypothetical protein
MPNSVRVQGSGVSGFSPATTGFWLLVSGSRSGLACFIRFIGLIGLISSISSV